MPQLRIHLPSGVQYGHLVDIGRKLVDEQVDRPTGEKLQRWLLKEGMNSSLFAPALKLGRAVQGFAARVAGRRFPLHRMQAPGPREHAQVLLLAGCVQPAMMPRINYATARVLDAVGVQTVIAGNAGCCGAVKFHLNDQDGGKAQMRTNIDAWWPLVERGEVESIVMNASGCGAAVKEYGHLRHERIRRKKPRIARVDQSWSRTAAGHAARAGCQAARPAANAQGVACTLQHDQKLRGGVERALGF
ncbi:hypothetical protein J4714_13695 [Staphylococcus epidermidis]|nr:hypothetical protein [Staphylococcus epidermidis]